MIAKRKKPLDIGKVAVDNAGGRMEARMKLRRKKTRTPLQVAMGVLLERMDVSLVSFCKALDAGDGKPESHQNVNQKMSRHEPKIETIRQLAGGLGIDVDELQDQMVHEYERAQRAGRPLACRPMYRDDSRAVVVLA